MLVWLPDNADERALIERAATTGIGLTGVTWCCMTRPPRRGIVFGYAAVDERRIEEGVHRLSRLI